MRLTNNTIVKAILLGMTVCTLSCQKASLSSGEGEIILSIEGDDGFDVETKATPVTAIPSTLYWGMTQSNGTVKQATVSKSVSSSQIATGYYQTLSPTTYIHYVANASFTAGGAMTVANNGTDIIVGKSSSSSTTPSVVLNHIFARTGTFTCNTQSGYTISNVSWTISSSGSVTGTAGTYDMASQSWTSRSSALAETAVSSGSDLFLLPGQYTVKVTYTLTKGDYVATFTKSGTVTLVAGKVNNISCTAIGASASEIVISCSLTAWGTQSVSMTLS